MSSNGVSRKFQGCLKFQGCFKEILRMIKDSLKVISRKFEGFFMGVLSVFQGSFNGVLRKFHGRFKELTCFMKVTRKVEGSYDGI